MTDADPNLQEILQTLRSLERQVRWLTVVVSVMVLAMFLLAAAVFGSLVNYFAFDRVLYGGVSAGCAVLGFAFGWFARRRA